MSNSVQPHRQQPTRLPHSWDSPGKNTRVGCHFLLQFLKVKSVSEVAQLCPILSDPRTAAYQGSSVHGIFQTRVLEWGAIAFSVLYSRPLQICLFGTYKWNHIICDLFIGWLLSLCCLVTYHYVFEVHLCHSMCWYSIPFYCWVTFYCVLTPHFIYPFISCWIFGLFPFLAIMSNTTLCSQIMYVSFLLDINT